SSLKGLITASIFFIRFPSPGLPAARHRLGRPRLTGSVPSLVEQKKRQPISHLTGMEQRAPGAINGPRIRFLAICLFCDHWAYPALQAKEIPEGRAGFGAALVWGR